jgi:Ca-activated chloride channel family protein
MFEVAWWWAVLFLPLPLLARSVLPAVESAELALAVPLLNQHKLSRQPAAMSSNRLAKICLGLFWICLVAAACRPLWLGEPISRSVSGRDLMLAVDISGSMQEADMRINGLAASRLDVLKYVVGEFIDGREGDRLGLILFGTNAYSYVPLTFDLATLKKLLQDVSAGLAGRYTAIGDAIGLAVKLMRQQASAHRVLILVTDGSNTAGINDPMIAALIAREEGLTIHTIGVGTDEQALSKEYGVQSIPAGTALNERLLRSIAAETGGKYFRATNSQSLEQIYATLDKLELIEREFQSYRPRTELFYWPLLLGILTMLFYLAWKISWSTRND